MDETPADRLRKDDYALRDLIFYAKRAVGHCALCPNREAFELDVLTQDATSWCLIVVGEAANRMSAEAKALAPNVPWRQVIDMRNRMIHQYHRLRLDIVWDTVRNDLAPLIRAAEDALQAMPPTPDRSTAAEPAGPS